MYCCYCKRELIDPRYDRSHRRSHPLSLTYDHVMPKSGGGKRTVPCCRRCNQLKADMHPELWRVLTAAYPGWWNRFQNHKEALIAAGRAFKEAQLNDRP